MAGTSHTRAPALVEETVWMAAAAVAGRAFGVRAADVIDCRGRQTRAGRRLLLARRVALYLAYTGAGLSSRALQRASGMAGKTVRYHLAQAEDSRDVLTLDALLDELTDRLQSAAPRLGRAA
jgi:hypothetical protein